MPYWVKDVDYKCSRCDSVSVQTDLCSPRWVPVGVGGHGCGIQIIGHAGSWPGTVGCSLCGPQCTNVKPHQTVHFMYASLCVISMSIGLWKML